MEILTEECTCRPTFQNCVKKLNGKTWNIGETMGAIEYSLKSYAACERACNYALTNPGSKVTVLTTTRYSPSMAS